MRTLAVSIAVAIMFSKLTTGPQAQALRGHSTSLDVNRALGVECSHCHIGVDCSHCHVSRDWSDASKPAHQTVKVMSTIFELIPTYFDPAKPMPSTQCFMCHQGHIKVEQTYAR